MDGRSPIDDIPPTDLSCGQPVVNPSLAGRGIDPTPWRAPPSQPERHGVLTQAEPHDKAAIARQICDVMRMMYNRQLVVANDGNVSARLPNGNIMITASGVLKGYMTPDQVIECDPDGRALDGRKVTTEIKMHVGAYKMRPEVGAVVHAHPIHAVAFSLAGISLAGCVIPEIIVTMGSIPTAAYGTPSTNDLFDNIKPHLANGDAVIMERHGVVCVGSDLFDAYKKMEMVEHTAKITHAARTLGGELKPLPAQDVQALLDTRRALGVEMRNNLCQGCGAKESCAAPLFPD